MTGAGGRQPLSVVVLTLDEERLIGRCLDSVAFADEAVVVDSGSTDRTREIAAERGARVIEQEWLGWSPQRMRGIDAASHDWVFCLEADEVVGTQLANAIQAALSGDPDPTDGYSFDRRDDFLGALMPNEARRRNREAFVRLFNRTRSHWDPGDVVHERVAVAGRRIPLDGVLLHWRGSGLAEMIATANRYAGVEAGVLADAGRRARTVDLALRPALRFGWCYLVKGGWRLGARGLLWAGVRAFAEGARWGRLWELQHRSELAADPPDALVSTSFSRESR